MTTHTVGSGKDYATIAAAVADSGVVSGDTLVIDAGSYGGWSTTKNLTYEAASGASTTGEPGASGVVYISGSGGGSGLITLSGTGTSTLDGLEIHLTDSGTSSEAIRANGEGSTLNVKNCLIYAAAAGGYSQQDAIYVDKTNQTINVENTIAFSWGRAFIDVFWSTSNLTGTVTINSSHIYDVGGNNEPRAGVVGVSGAANSIINLDIFNSLLHISGFNSVDNQVIYTNFDFNGSIDVDRCITNNEDIDNTDTQTDCLVSHNWTDDNTKASDGDWIIVENVTTYPYDLRLVDQTYNVAQDLHADDTGAGLTMPSTDIVGTSRPQNTNYDVGAFEIVAGGTDVNVIPTTELLQITTPQVEVFQDIDVFPVTETFAIATPAVDVQVGSDITVNPLTELLQITTPQVTVQYFPFVNVDVQTETLLISTPPVNVEVFEDTTVIPATQFLNIITPPVDVNVGFDVDVNPLTEFLDIATPQVDVKTPVEFLIATEAQPLQYQVAVGGIVQMRAQLNVNAWRNENNWVSTPFPAVISTQPVGGSVTPGGAVSLSVTAIGAATYQWYLDGAALIGETGSTLNTTAPVIPGDYNYTCLALNADGFGIRSNAATVTVPTASAFTIGNSGFLNGFRPPDHPTTQFGDLVPDTIDGVRVWQFTANSSNDIVVLAMGVGGTTQLPGVGQITVLLDGTPVVVIPWDGAQNRYQLIDAAFAAHIVANVGNTLNTYFATS